MESCRSEMHRCSSIAIQWRCYGLGPEAGSACSLFAWLSSVEHLDVRPRPGFSMGL